MKQCYALVGMPDGSVTVQHVRDINDNHFYKREAEAWMQAEYPGAEIVIYGIRSPLIANILEEYGEGGGK